MLQGNGKTASFAQVLRFVGKSSIQMFHSRHDVPLVPGICLLLLVLKFIPINFSYELLKYLFAHTQKGYIGVCTLHFTKMPPTLTVLYSLTIPPCWQDWVYNYLKYIWLNVLTYNAAISIWESDTSFIDRAELIHMVNEVPYMIHFIISLVYPKLWALHGNTTSSSWEVKSSGADIYVADR